MGFLYRSSDLGPVGETESGIKVHDMPEVTVLSTGFVANSGSSLDSVAQAIDHLKELLS